MVRRSEEEEDAEDRERYMALDGRGVFPEYPTSGPPSTEPNPLFRNMWYDRFGRHDGRHGSTLLSRASADVERKGARAGRGTWLLDYRRFLDKVDKVCLSHRLKSPDWENSRILKGDLAKIITSSSARKAGTSSSKGDPA